MVEKNGEYLFIDGYNVINAWPELIEAKSVSLETARDKLVDIMADYAAQTGINVVVVFDAHNVEGGRGGRYHINGVEVVFTREGETADNYIEKTVSSLGMGNKIRVATSDWIEQQIVMGHGAIRLSARELRNEVMALAERRRQLEERKKLERQTLEERIDKKIWRLIMEHLKGGRM
ncbi:MAG: NYN domain-containing protein [Thermosediminibacteraceae bacterium]|nr:NYN domain-containing protein [Thermosediminibacteraceae bacterium]